MILTYRNYHSRLVVAIFMTIVVVFKFTVSSNPTFLNRSFNHNHNNNSYTLRGQVKDKNRDDNNHHDVDNKIDNNNNRMLESKSMKKPSVLVTYSVNLKESSECQNNLKFFFQHGVVNESHIQYIFSVPSNYKELHLDELINPRPNVKVIDVDVLSTTYHQRQRNMIQQNKDKFDIFLLLSCVSLGPFYFTPTKEPTSDWIDLFVNKLRENVKIVGSTISCEISTHVQSYAMAISKEVIDIAIEVWANPFVKNVNADTAFTSAILSKGFNVASLDSRYAGRNFIGTTICDPQFENVGHSNLANPIACWKNSYGPIINTPGCLGLHPCEVIFVIVNEIHTPKETLDHVHTLLSSPPRDPSKPYSSGMCYLEIPPARPYWDAIQLYENISSYSINPENLSKNISSELVMVIRIHAAYACQLVSMLWGLEGTNWRSNITVIILPTQLGALTIVKELVMEGFLNKNYQPSIHVIFFDIPNWLYERYGNYLNQICTDKWKHSMIASGLIKPSFASRSCLSNSPLQYLLADIVLHHIHQKCQNCYSLIVTNAHNLYSPLYFNNLFQSPNERYRNYDMFTTDVVADCKLVPASVGNSHIDLGGYTTSLEFLKNTGISFLNSLPSHPDPKDYHNVDGHFIDRLQSYKARSDVQGGYHYYHI